MKYLLILSLILLSGCSDPQWGEATRECDRLVQITQTPADTARVWRLIVLEPDGMGYPALQYNCKDALRRPSQKRVETQ